MSLEHTLSTYRKKNSSLNKRLNPSSYGSIYYGHLFDRILTKTLYLYDPQTTITLVNITLEITSILALNSSVGPSPCVFAFIKKIVAYLTP